MANILQRIFLSPAHKNILKAVNNNAMHIEYKRTHVGGMFQIQTPTIQLFASKNTITNIASYYFSEYSPNGQIIYTSDEYFTHTAKLVYNAMQRAFIARHGHCVISNINAQYNLQKQR